MNTPVEEIKSRLDLVELIQSYVRLHKAGINYKANCPFHSEKTPSFFVSPSRQIWHCFGCGAGGDVLKFVMQIEGYDFPEALQTLATRAGVVLKREDPTIRSERNRVHSICEEAAKIFERNLALTSPAKAYLKKRGVEDKTVQEFRIGFAPQSWDFLLRALAQKGFKKGEIEKAGLAIKSGEGASWYDRFRSRIMFPIADSNGRVVGFSGRMFEMTSDKQQATSEAKYVNTPNTLIYDKSRALYGFDKAKQEIRIKNQAVVVEGQMDCLMSWQAGIKNVIAVSGTALTPQQLKTIRRLCDTMISSFDTDSAGESATKRSLELASQMEFNCKIARITSGKDPADAVLTNPQEWQETVENAKPIVDFYFEEAFRKFDKSSAEGKKSITASTLPWISKLSNEVEKAHWMGALSLRLGVKEDALWKELQKIKRVSEGWVRPSPDEEEKKEKPKTRRELLEERLLALLAVMEKDTKVGLLAGGVHFTFTAPIHQELFPVLAEDTPPSAADLQNQADLFRFKGEVLRDLIPDAQEEFALTRRELEKECLKEELTRIGAEIEEKERERNQEALKLLLEQFNSASQKLKQYP